MNDAKFNKLGPLNSFLTGLSPDWLDYKKLTEEQAIPYIVKELNAIGVQETLAEGREVLALDPFPWEWVTDLVGSYWDKEAQKLIEDPIFYHKWLKKVLDILEEEARKQGKLTSYFAG